LFLVPAAPGVEFVAVFVFGQIFWSGGEGCRFEVLVSEGVDGIDSFSPVQTKELFEQIQAVWADTGAEALIDVAFLRIPVFVALAAWQFGPARHVGVVRRAD
jgi:hypothetical protein